MNSGDIIFIVLDIIVIILLVIMLVKEKPCNCGKEKYCTDISGGFQSPCGGCQGGTEIGMN